MLELIKVNVAYPSNFVRAIASKERGAQGPKSARVFWNSNEQSVNVLLGVFEWESIEQAVAYWASEDGQAERAAWHSVVEPTFERLQGA